MANHKIGSGEILLYDNGEEKEFVSVVLQEEILADTKGDSGAVRCECSGGVRASPKYLRRGSVGSGRNNFHNGNSLK